MKRYQSVLTLVIGLVAVVLVSCGSPTAIKPPTYTPLQIERIQQSLPKLLVTRERVRKQLNFEIQNQRWQDIRAFIHGPLGQTLQDMNNLARNLAPEVQQDARQVSRALSNDLVDIDEAAKEQKAAAAGKAYQSALEDFERFFQLVPPEAQAQVPEPLGVEPQPEETVEAVPVPPQPVEVIPAA